jgi:hypothetical protein
VVDYEALIGLSLLWVPQQFVWPRVPRKMPTQVMYIAKLKDGPKRVKKTFSMILERVFEMI